jgi:hypothetical protein
MRKIALARAMRLCKKTAPARGDPQAADPE